ncbi:MAG: hypothetical protein Q9226_003116 [Calogaya cf. arnoldii]
MKLSFFPSRETSISKRSKLHHRTATGGVGDGRSKNVPGNINAIPVNPATRAEINVGKGEFSPRTSTVSKSPQEFQDGHAQRALPRVDDLPTPNPSTQPAGYEARPPQTSFAPPLECNEDNALRGLLRFYNDARFLCPPYLAGQLADDSLVTIVGPYPPPQVSSACSCFESKLSTGWWGATTRDPFQDLVQSYLPQSTMDSDKPATEDATFPRPSEHLGPMTSEVTLTAEVVRPTSILGYSISSTPSKTVTLTSATASAGAAAAFGDASLWRGGGDTLAPGVVAVIVRCSHTLVVHCPRFAFFDAPFTESTDMSDPYKRTRSAEESSHSLAKSIADSYLF